MRHPWKNRPVPSLRASPSSVLPPSPSSSPPGKFRGKDVLPKSTVSPRANELPSRAPKDARGEVYRSDIYLRVVLVFYNKDISLALRDKPNGKGIPEFLSESTKNIPGVWQHDGYHIPILKSAY